MNNNYDKNHSPPFGTIFFTLAICSAILAFFDLKSMPEKQAVALAQWVQVTPVAGPCNIPVSATENGSPEKCPPAFRVRAVVSKDDPCPSAMVTYRGWDERVDWNGTRSRSSEPFKGIKVCDAELSGGRPLDVSFTNGTTIPVTKAGTAMEDLTAGSPSAILAAATKKRALTNRTARTGKTGPSPASHKPPTTTKTVRISSFIWATTCM